MIAYRQGDVILIKIDKDKVKQICGYNPVKLSHGIIREGEKSGHTHEVKQGDLFGDEKGTPKVVDNTKGQAKIVHPEHKEIKPEKGLYEVQTQKEYDETKDGKKKEVKD